MSGVSRDRGEAKVAGCGDAERLRYFGARPHPTARPPDRLTAHYVAPSCRTISRSSNGCFSVPIT